MHTSEKGLSDAEGRRRKHGRNELRSKPRKQCFKC
ncbi:MAG: cation-transporting P-type ATPase [Hungatella hathewayi]